MASPLIIRLTRTSPTHHRFEYVRADGTGERAEFETRSVLFHDLLHFAVESEARLTRSFYGLLNDGQTFEALATAGEQWKRGVARGLDEIIMTERIVGPLTPAVRGQADPAAILAAIRNQLAALGESMPAWLSIDFVERVRERMRHLVGRWNATPFGSSMEMIFEVE